MFKKIGLLLVSVFALGFASCDDIEDVAPQANAPEASMELEGLSVEAGSDFATGAVNLGDIARLNVVNTVDFPNLRDGQNIEYKMLASATEDFAKSSEIALEGTVASATDIDNVFRALIGKTDNACDMYFRFAAYLVYGDGAKVRFGDQNTYFASTKVAVTPIALGLPFVAESYELEANGKIVAEFKQKGGGDVYDNAYFSAKVTIAVEDFVEDEEMGESWLWRIIAKDAEGQETRTVFAPTEDFCYEVEGELETNADGVTPGYGNFPLDGNWIFSFNANDLTFKIEEAPVPPTVMYLVGQPSGWSEPSAGNAAHYESWKLEDNDGDLVFSGTFEVPAGAFIFRFYTALTGWDGGASFGSQVADSPIDITMDGGVYTGAALYGKGSWQVPGWTGGTVAMDVDWENGVVTFTKK